MSTTVESTDLGWVTFTDEDGEPCAVLSMPCSREAAVAAIWQTVSARCPERQPLCMEHADLARRRAAQGTRWSCGCRLLRIEPLR